MKIHCVHLVSTLIRMYILLQRTDVFCLEIVPLSLVSNITCIIFCISFSFLIISIKKRVAMVCKVAGCGQEKWSLICAIGKMFFFYHIQHDSGVKEPPV